MTDDSLARSSRIIHSRRDPYSWGELRGQSDPRGDCQRHYRGFLLKKRRSAIGSRCFYWVRIDLNRRDRLPVALKICSWPLSNCWIELIQKTATPCELNSLGINLKEIKRAKAPWEMDDRRGTQFSIHQAFSTEI
uniref:Uncharacterized protein n=1 Tax=Musa acuminata subsp. malaccensis TaxID=214687 RepID=A0A804IM53_MUSAM